MKKFLYNLAKNYVLKQHRQWRDSGSEAGIKLVLSGEDLSMADFSRAFLADTNFTGANLTNANLSNCNVKSTNFNGTLVAMWGENRAKLLDNMFVVATPDGPALRVKEDQLIDPKTRSPFVQGITHDPNHSPGAQLPES